MSGLFSDPDLFRAIRVEVAPRLRTYPTARVWVPACGSGEEAISLAILLREERVPRVMVYATDGEVSVFERARSGEVQRDALSSERYAASGGRASLSEYFSDDGHTSTIRPLILSGILFAQHALETDGSINEFQLVHVGARIAEFDSDVRRRALYVIDESLCPLGTLGLADPSLVTLLPINSYDRVGETDLWKKRR